jgi:hypothetical protein
MHHAAGCFHNGPIIAFRGPVLFGSVCGGEFLTNSLLFKIHCEFLVRKLGSFIATENLQQLPCFPLELGEESFERSERIWLSFDTLDNPETSGVIFK